MGALLAALHLLQHLVEGRGVGRDFRSRGLLLHFGIYDLGPYARGLERFKRAGRYWCWIGKGGDSISGGRFFSRVEELRRSGCFAFVCGFWKGGGGGGGEDCRWR